MARCIGRPLFEFLNAIFEEGAKLLDRPFDTGSDLAGLFVARGLGKFGAGMREGPQGVPPFYHMAGGTGNGVERLPQISGGRLKVFGEVHLFFALQGASSADFLKIRFKGTALSAGVEFIRCNDGCGAHDGGCRCGIACCGFGLVLSGHFPNLSILWCNSKPIGYRPGWNGFKPLVLLSYLFEKSKFLVPWDSECDF